MGKVNDKVAGCQTKKKESAGEWGGVAKHDTL